MPRYENKKVVITGGGSGVGLAATQLLVDEGARVLITGRTKETLDATAEQLGSVLQLVVQGDSAAVGPQKMGVARRYRALQSDNDGVLRQRRISRSVVQFVDEHEPGPLSRRPPAVYGQR